MLLRIKKHCNYRAVRHFYKKNLKSRLKHPLVSFTFDDFPKSAWQVGGQILENHKAKGSYYFVADLCGKTIDDRIYYDERDLTNIHRSGHEIGCHTSTHARLSNNSIAASLHEFTANSSFLNKIIPGQKLSTFAYPFGDVTPRVKRVAMNEFAACRGIWAGINHNFIDLGLIKTVCLEEHVLAQRPVDSWIEEAIEKNGWLVFLTHEVEENHGYFGISPGEFESVVSRVMQAGIDILPVKNAVGCIAHGGQ